MKKLLILSGRILGVAALVGALGACKSLSSTLTPQAPTANSFVGSETCGTCHADLYNFFLLSAHPHVARTVADAANAPSGGLPEVPLDEFPGIGQTGSGVGTASDLLLVIGGINWEAQFVNAGGFVVEGPQAQFTLNSSSWEQYGSSTWKGADQAYDYATCLRCHTTGASPNGHPDGYPQINGSWKYLGIQCERCHGMGFRHVNYREPPVNLQPIATCQQCHNENTTSMTILASGNFIAGGDQYNEFRNNAMSSAQGMTCVSCHNPHKRAKLDVGNWTCKSCHVEKAASYLGSMHDAANVGCIDCHMAETGVEGAPLFENPAKGTFRGDLKSHLLRITTDPNYLTFMANPDTNTKADWPLIMNTGKDNRGIAGPFITLGYACGKCHQNNTPALFGQAIANHEGDVHTLSTADAPAGWVTP